MLASINIVNHVKKFELIKFELIVVFAIGWSPMAFKWRGYTQSDVLEKLLTVLIYLAFSAQWIRPGKIQPLPTMAVGRMANMVQKLEAWSLLGEYLRNPGERGA